MPTLDISSYIIDFLILESNDPKTIVILDRSVYLQNPEKPELIITLPGYTGHITVPYNVENITVLDSDSLKLTEPCEYDVLSDLPDGVWHIRQQICPSDEMFTSKCYLKSTSLEEMFNLLLLSIDQRCFACMDKDVLNKSIMEIEILIKCAKLETSRCNSQQGIEKYNAAFKKLQKLKRLLNDCI